LQTYDKNKDGKLDKDEAVTYLKDVLEVTGLSKQIWDDAVVTDDPKQYFNDLVVGLFDELRKKKCDYLEVEDLTKVSGFDAQKLQDMMTDISERIEESYQEQLFQKYDLARASVGIGIDFHLDCIHRALRDDIDALKEAYKSHELIKSASLVALLCRSSGLT